jgi:hypothetical protein
MQAIFYDDHTYASRKPEPSVQGTQCRSVHSYLFPHLLRGVSSALTEPTSRHLCTQAQRCPLHLIVTPAQPLAKLRDGSLHKAGLANLAPCLLRLRAKLSEKADDRHAQVAVGLNRERDEGVSIRLQLAIHSPLLPIPSPRGAPRGPAGAAAVQGRVPMGRNERSSGQKIGAPRAYAYTYVRQRIDRAYGHHPSCVQL